MAKSYSNKYRDNVSRVYIVPKESESFTVKPHKIGHEQCAPGLLCSKVREYTVIHYVYSGKGVFEKDGIVYNLSAGDAFVINEGEYTSYCSDSDTPWYYYWLSFSSDSFGGRFKNLKSPVVKIKNASIFTEPVYRAENGTLTYEFTVAKLYELYDEIFASPPKSEDYVVQTSRYILDNLAKKLTVESIASSLGLNRSYLTRRFKQQMGVSVKQYIMSMRAVKGMEYLESGYSVKQTAFMTGFDDQFAFSRMFKKYYGIPPAKATHNTERRHPR